MVTSISLGSIFQQGDRTIVSGGSSGIDTESMINGLVEAKRLPAVQLEERIPANYGSAS